MAMSVKRVQSRGRITTLRERILTRSGKISRLPLTYANNGLPDSHSLAAEEPGEYGDAPEQDA
jgi:hypothetical protein